MYRQICFLMVLVAFCTSASAQYANVEGKFRSSSTSLDLIALDSETGVIAASTTVVMGACSGTVAGIGKISGKELTFSPYVKIDKNDACVVKVAFDKKFNSAKITAEGCAAYSGTACGWEGDTIKRAK